VIPMVRYGLGAEELLELGRRRGFPVMGVREPFLGPRLRMGQQPSPEVPAPEKGSGGVDLGEAVMWGLGAAGVWLVVAALTW
jgi:hypothetical protein